MIPTFIGIVKCHASYLLFAFHFKKVNLIVVAWIIYACQGIIKTLEVEKYAHSKGCIKTEDCFASLWMFIPVVNLGAY